jgi:3-oxoadipate enol-lactonase
MPHASVNDQQLHYEDTGGDGPAVILSHGFMMDGDMFEPQVGALRDAYRVITWAERGFGRRVFDGEPFTYWDSARDCLGLLDNLGVDRAVFGGMSQGGFLSLRAALLAPERVRALILLDTQAGLEDPALVEGYREMVRVWLDVGPVPELADAIAGIIIDDAAVNEVWISKWQQRDKSMIEQPFECLMSRDDFTDRLADISCPALVVHGTSDMGITIDRAHALAAGLPGAGAVVEVAGAHTASLTNPVPVNAAIVGFLDGLAG